MYEHDREQAEDLFRRSLGLYQALDARWEAADVTTMLAYLASSMGAYDRARQFYSEGLAAFRELGAPIQAAFTLNGLGLLDMMQGHLKVGERRLRESYTIWEQAIGARPVGAPLGWLLMARGRFAEAEQVLREGIASRRERGLTEAFPRTWLAAVETHQGRYERGRADAERALAVRRELGVPQQIAATLMVLSWVSLAEGAHERAEELLQESVDLYRQVAQPDEGSWALACLGYAARGMGQRDRAWAHLSEAMRTGIEIHAFFPMISGLPMAALLLAEEEQAERALEVYAAASSYGYVGNSRWFKDVAERHIAAAAQELPPEVVAAAQERGRGRDLWEIAEELVER